MLSFSLLILALLRLPAFSEETDPKVILDKTQAAYKAMQTYKAEGTAATNVEMSGQKIDMDTTFSVTMKKPNSYLVTWTQKMPMVSQTGVVWSDGTQPYIYIDAMKAYSKMADDKTAIAVATGVSGGVANTLTSFFMQLSDKNAKESFARLKEPKLENAEKVDGEDCYVIGSESDISKKETYWITKSKYLIVKYSRSLEQPEGGVKVPDPTDEELTQSAKAMGMEATEENKKKIRDMAKQQMEAAKNMNIKGTIVETYSKIASPELSKKDFEFSVPEGTALKDSLFKGAMGGQ